MRYSVKPCCKKFYYRGKFCDSNRLRNVFRLYSTVFLVIILMCSKISAQTDTLNLPAHSNEVITSLNFKDTDIRDVLRSVAYEYHVNIVIDNQLNQKISVTLFNIRILDALKIIADDYSLDFRYDKNRFYYKRPPEKEKPAPQEPEPDITLVDKLLTIKLQNVDITKFIGKLSEVTGKNFLLSSGTSGRLTGTLSSITLEGALKHLLFNNGFYYQLKDSIFYISRSAFFSSNDKNAATTQPYWVSAFGGKVTVDINQANLDRVITDLAQQLQLQVVKLAVPSVNVTLKCVDMPVEKAFYYLFRGTEFTYKIDEGIYIIGNKTSKSMENTKLVRLNYLQADKIKEKIPAGITQNVLVQVIPEHNALVLNGTVENLESVEEYLHAIDQPVPQVLIEALVVDYNLDNMMQYGISAGRGDSTTAARASTWAPGLDVTASGAKINKILSDIGSIKMFNTDINVGKWAKLPDDFYANIKFLEDHGIANVRSKPLLSALNGHTASLKIGTVQNYVLTDVVPFNSTTGTTLIEKENIQKLEATISFEITPWVGPNNEMTLEIKPDFQTPVSAFTPQKGNIPAINTRSLTSTVRLRDGETIILGGLIQESDNDSKIGLPFISDIPIIGDFFSTVDKKKTKGELIIYLTPKINYGDELGYSYQDLSR